MSEEEDVKKILKEAKDQLKLECRIAIFEEKRKLRVEDLYSLTD